jgi:long-chain acyl-CoA synthetase
VPVLLDSQTPDAEAQRVMAAMGAAGLASCGTAWPENPHDFSFQPFSGNGEVRLTDPAIIKLTSGSTGEARGIEAPLEALLADEENLAATMGIKEADRLLVAVPMAHSYGLSSLAVPALVRGTTLIIPEAGNPFSPLQAAAELGATVFPTTPSYLEGLAQWEGALPDLDDLRLLLSAGAALRPETARRIRQSWGHPVHAFYGASECGGIAYDPEGRAAEEGLVGKPVRQVSIKLEEVADRETPGMHLVIRSPAVARRYLPREDQRLGGGRFLSDDLATLEGSSLRLHGRLGPVVKIRGKKVHPAEVEQILAQMPGIKEAYVHAEETAGAGGDTLEAFVVLAGHEVTRSEITEWCRRHLVPEKVPRRIQLVAELPRTERGKVEASQVLRLRT